MRSESSQRKQSQFVAQRNGTREHGIEQQCRVTQRIANQRHFPVAHDARGRKKFAQRQCIEIEIRAERRIGGEEHLKSVIDNDAIDERRARPPPHLRRGFEHQYRAPGTV